MALTFKTAFNKNIYGFNGKIMDRPSQLEQE
jgi:hypothetical protein